MAANVRYREIYTALKDEILSGKYFSTHPIPSSNALARRFMTSRATIRQALDRLRVEGLVASQRGSGTFVTKQGASRLIGLVVPGVSYSSEYFQKIIAALVVEAQRNDYSILVDGAWGPDAKGNGHEAIEVAARLIRRRVAGVIYHPVEHSDESDGVNRRVLAAFVRAKIPVALLDSDIVPWPERSSFDLVSVDNVGAGSALARHLIGQGAKNIRFLMRKNLIGNLVDRVKGVEAAVRSSGGKWGRTHVLTADPLDSEAIAKIMRRRPSPDAFICENDGLAARLRMTLSGLRYAVPDDVRVAGFDDAEMSRSFVPSVTTVSWSAAALAEMAFARLRWRIARPDLSPLTFLVPHALKVGSSTAASPKRPRK